MKTNLTLTQCHLYNIKLLINEEAMTVLGLVRDLHLLLNNKMSVL